MESKRTDSRAQREEALVGVFGQGAATAAKVLGLIEPLLAKVWQVDEIVDEVGEAVIDVVVIVGRLTHHGFVHHDGVGSGYRAKNPVAIRLAS